MGDNGEQVLLELELKSIADIGVSNAKPCVSSLPFTTLNPHIGHIRTGNGTTLSIADIPDK